MEMDYFLRMLVDEFQGVRLRVHTSGHVYEGWGREWKDERAVVLYDATRDDAEQFDAVMVGDVVSVESLEERRPIRRVPPESIRPMAYSVRTHDGASNAAATRKARQFGSLESYPVVRPVPDGDWEVVSGHRRVRGAARAGMDTVPVRVVELDDWEALRRFVDEHVPLPQEREDRAPTFYTDEEIAAAFEAMLDDWSLDELATLPALAPEVDARRSEG